MIDEHFTMYSRQFQIFKFILTEDNISFFVPDKSYKNLIAFKIQTTQGNQMTEKSDTLEKISMTECQNGRIKESSSDWKFIGIIL